MRLRQNETLHLHESVTGLLTHEDTREVSGTGGGGTAHQILGIWQTREQLNRNTDHPLIGATALMDVLKSMKQQRKVTQAGFTGKTYTGVFFFDKSSGNALGYVVVRTRTDQKKKERLHHEASLVNTPAPLDERLMANLA